MNNTIDINQPIEVIIDLKIEAIREIIKPYLLEIESLIRMKEVLGKKTDSNNDEPYALESASDSKAVTFILNGKRLDVSQKNIKPLVLDILKNATKPLSSPLIYEILKNNGLVTNDKDRQKWVLSISASLGSLCKYNKISMVGDAETNPKFYSFGTKKPSQTLMDLIEEDEELKELLS